MLAAPTPVALLRYWTHSTPFDLLIRVEYRDEAGQLATTVGALIEDSGRAQVSWQYGDVPEDLADVALECALSAGEWVVAGVEYCGNETAAAMGEAVEMQEAA